MGQAHSIRTGFTLIEVMLVAAITGVLAAAAVPNFLSFSDRAKAAEGKTNLAAIRVAEEAYWSEYGTYVATTIVPNSIPGSTPVNWNSDAGFARIGWKPEGRVLFAYRVSADDNGLGGELIRFTAEAGSDIDNDGVGNFWAIVKPAPGENVGIAGALPGSTCAATGVYNPETATTDLLNAVGPCDADSGRLRF